MFVLLIFLIGTSLGDSIMKLRNLILFISFLMLLLFCAQIILLLLGLSYFSCAFHHFIAMLYLCSFIFHFCDLLYIIYHLIDFIRIAFSRFLGINSLSILFMLLRFFYVFFLCVTMMIFLKRTMIIN